MSIITDLKAIHKVSIRDIKRNYVLIGTVLLSLIVCFSMLFLGGTVTEKKRWMVYAVFLSISNFTIPLIYYIRYGDKNKRIISTVIYTKMHNIILYEYLMGLYHILIFSVTYGVVILFLSIWKTVHILDMYLFFSSICIWCVTNGICILCLNLFHRYYIGLIVYIILYVFFLISNSVAIGFLFPFHYENNSMLYFIGKIIELLLVGFGNIIMIKKRLSYR